MFQLSLFRIGRSRPLLIAVATLLLASLVHGQAVPDAASSSSSTAIVKNVDEVSVDFVTLRRNSPVVLQLKPEDIEVTDEGSKVKVSELRLVTGKSDANHLVTLLFDSLDPSAQTNAREVAEKVLNIIPEAGFSFSVFALEERVRLFQEFTPDRKELKQAINLVTSDKNPSRDQAAAVAERKLISALQSGATESKSSGSGDSRWAQRAILASLMTSPRAIQEHPSMPSLASLLAVVRAQTQIPGRKLLIYFTEGLKPNPDAGDMVRSVADAANRAEVSIYVINKTAVDTKAMDGLMAAAAVGQVAATNHFSPLFPTASQQNAAPSVSGPGLGTSLTDTLVRLQGEGLAANGDPLAGVAVSTGGAYLFSEDDLKKPFRHAITELTTYYEVSYIPPKFEYDGKFRQVTVKSLKRHLTVRARAGYFAVPPAATITPFEAPLLRVLSQPQLPSDLEFRSAVLQLGKLPTGNESALVVEVPISSLETRSDPNANLLSWHASIVSEVKDQAGNVVEHFSGEIPGHGALDSKEKFQSSYATMQRHFTVAPGDYTLETAIVDHYSGKMGGQRVHFEVTNAASGPFLSDVAVVRRIDPSPEELDPFEPLRYQQGKIIPSLAGQISSEAKDLSFFFLVDPDSNVPGAAMLELELRRNGELFGQVPLQLPNDPGQAFPYLASLKTSSLGPGNYDLTLSMTQGGKIMERQASFSIAGPQLANAELGKTDPVGASKGDIAVADAGGGAGEILRMRRQPLVITSLPEGSVTRPSDDELQRILDGARKNAVNYAEKLPNFLCIEITDRSVDASGKGLWQRIDSYGELLHFIDHKETRTTVEVNGQTRLTQRADTTAPTSLGEFGHLLSLVFEPSSKADFHWKETDALGNGTVQVFDYRVDGKNGSMELSDSTSTVYPGFHGVAYIDSSTMGVRRITIEADDLPPAFSIHAASIGIDYDYVSVGAHDYLMPVRGTIRVQRGRREIDLNQVVFQDYRRFASQAKVIYNPK